MTMSKIFGAAAAALVLSAGVSMADPAGTASAAKPGVAASAQAKPVQTASMTKPHHQYAAKTEAGKACSAEADVKNLHGQPRRDFRKSCLKSAAAKAPIAKVQPASAKVAKPAAGSTTTAH